MASGFVAPSRALLDALSPISRPSSCRFSNRCLYRRNLSKQCRHISTTPTRPSEMEVDGQVRPRWSQTPPAMKAPVPVKPRPANYKPYKVNSDPMKLDAMYNSLLGKEGDKVLSEETKWLAVTHKSFDHGRRGFNERLAYLGKRIVELQLSLTILNTASPSYAASNVDPHGREPFHHPATANIEVLTGPRRSHLSHHVPMSKLAQQHGVHNITRWQPRNPEDLIHSGCDVVYAQTLYAIIGAIALERGGAVANEYAKERILRPMGLKVGFQAQIETQQATEQMK